MVNMFGIFDIAANMLKYIKKKETAGCCEESVWESVHRKPEKIFLKSSLISILMWRTHHNCRSFGLLRLGFLQTQTITWK